MLEKENVQDDFEGDQSLNRSRSPLSLFGRNLTPGFRPLSPLPSLLQEHIYQLQNQEETGYSWHDLVANGYVEFVDTEVGVDWGPGVGAAGLGLGTRCQGGGGS